MRGLLKGLLAVGIVFSAFAWGPDITVEIPHVYQVATASLGAQTVKESASLFFVGDIMLGRGVEALVEKHGMSYPFEHVSALVSSADIAVGNFEGVVAREHVRAPSMTFQFAIRNEYLTQLRTTGFDVLSLANNHSLDHGEDALSFTKEICVNLGVVCKGFPNTVNENSIAIKKVGVHQIGFLFLSTVWGDMEDEEVEKLLEVLNRESTFQIAYVHWGEEYELTHNASQEKLAKMLVDGGIDLVVGHHPHVVQDVALYNGKVIFYSLGNFVFDQYFSEEVGEGLGVGLTLTDEVVRYRLIVFRNDIARSQPHTATKSDSLKLFSRVLEGIKDEEGVSVEDGILRLENTSE